MAAAVNRGPRRGIAAADGGGWPQVHGKTRCRKTRCRETRCTWEVIIGGEVLEELCLHHVAEPDPSARSAWTTMLCISSPPMLSPSKQILESLVASDGVAEADPAGVVVEHLEHLDVLAGPFSFTLPVDHNGEELGEVVAIAIQTIFLSSSVLASKPRERTAVLSSRMGRCHNPMHTPVSSPVWLRQALWVVGDVVPSVVATIGCGGWWG